MSETTTTNKQIDWEPLLIQLNAFTRALTKRNPWFRGNRAKTFLKGKEVEDYVNEAVCRYLENREKYNPNKGTLLEYLKLNLIRSLVINDVRREENRVTDCVDLNSYEEDSDSYIQNIYAVVETHFEDDIDYFSARRFVEKELEEDSIAENIFLAVYNYDMKRRETIEEFKMTEAEYDNGMRRLKTILNRATLHFGAVK